MSIPRVEQALQSFIAGWNNHSISHCKRHSPLYLYTNGMLKLQADGIPAIDFCTPVYSSYGVEVLRENYRLDVSQVELPPLPELSQELQDELATVDVLSNASDYGITLYITVLSVIETFFYE